MIGTVASLGAVVESQGWTLDAVLIAVAGTGLTFGLWWMYFTVPAAEVLQVHRERGFPWGFGHLLIFASIAATGAGLHVAATYIGHEGHIGAVATVLTLLAVTAAVLVASVVLATSGAPMAVCLVVLMLAPIVAVIGYETIGHRHMHVAVQRTLARGQPGVG